MTHAHQSGKGKGVVGARVSRCLSVPLVLALMLLLLAGLAPLPVRAAPFAVIVTMTDANSGNSDVIHVAGCATLGTAPCSLRDAVIFAKSKTTADTTTITLPAGTYTLTITGTGETGALSGDLNLNRNIMIVGAGRGRRSSSW